MKYNFIAIEGNIGAGKTTLASMLAKELNTQLILEEFAENPFLAAFYKNPEKYALPVELFFMAERYQQLNQELHTARLGDSSIISDYTFIKCLLFAKVNLPSEEFKLYQKLFGILQQQLSTPDILIYLHAPVSKLQENIKKRNREYEQSIPDQYLLNIEETYTNYIKQQNLKTIFINAANADFEENENHLAMVLAALDCDYTDGVHYFTLP